MFEDLRWWHVVLLLVVCAIQSYIEVKAHMGGDGE